MPSESSDVDYEAGLQMLQESADAIRRSFHDADQHQEAIAFVEEKRDRLDLGEQITLYRRNLVQVVLAACRVRESKRENSWARTDFDDFAVSIASY